MKNEIQVTLADGTQLPLSQALEAVAPVAPSAPAPNALEELMRVETFRERVQRSFQVCEPRREREPETFSRSVVL